MSEATCGDGVFAGRRSPGYRFAHPGYEIATEGAAVHIFLRAAATHDRGKHSTAHDATVACPSYLLTTAEYLFARDCQKLFIDRSAICHRGETHAPFYRAAGIRPRVSSSLDLMQ